MIDRRRAAPVLIAAALLAMLAPSCQKHIKSAPVEADRAREYLRTALESWKKGEKVNSLQAGSPPIYVIDTEWESGAVLKDFQLVSDGEPKDAQLYCPVKLTVRTAGGKEEERQVTYMVSTAPNVTVSRKVF